MTNGTTKKRSAMSAEHKAALAAGRAEARIVRDYLVALRDQHPRPGRKRTVESVQKRLRVVERELATLEAKGGADDDPIYLLELIQERLDLTAELDEMQAEDAFPAAEARFVEVAASFGERKGISYEAWRRLGVPSAVLRRAGVRVGAA